MTFHEKAGRIHGHPILQVLVANHRTNLATTGRPAAEPKHRMFGSCVYALEPLVAGAPVTTTRMTPLLRRGRSLGSAILVGPESLSGHRDQVPDHKTRLGRSAAIDRCEDARGFYRSTRLSGARGRADRLGRSAIQRRWSLSPARRRRPLGTSGSRVVNNFMRIAAQVLSWQQQRRLIMDSSSGFIAV